MDVLSPWTFGLLAFVCYIPSLILCVSLYIDRGSLSLSPSPTLILVFVRATLPALVRTKSSCNLILDDPVYQKQRLVSWQRFSRVCSLLVLVTLTACSSPNHVLTGTSCVIQFIAPCIVLPRCDGTDLALYSCTANSCLAIGASLSMLMPIMAGLSGSSFPSFRSQFRDLYTGRWQLAGMTQHGRQIAAVQ